MLTIEKAVKKIARQCKIKRKKAMQILADELILNYPGARLSLCAEQIDTENSKKSPIPMGHSIQIPGNTHPLNADDEATAIPRISHDPVSYTTWSAAYWLKAVANGEHGCGWDDPFKYTINQTTYSAPAKKFSGDILERAVRSINAARSASLGTGPTKIADVWLALAWEIYGDLMKEQKDPRSTEDIINYVRNRPKHLGIPGATDFEIIESITDDRSSSEISCILEEGNRSCEKTITIFNFRRQYMPHVPK